MLIYLWNLCKFGLLKITALLWNAIKRVQGEQPQQLMNNTAKCKVSMAVEVWTDVLSFVKRVELAHSVSLTNWQIHQICWPRLHGNKVMAHEPWPWEMIIARRRQHAFSWSSTAILLIRERLGKPKEVPFANCPPPDYITLPTIQIKFLDDQVLAFIKAIAPHLTETGVYINIGRPMGDVDEQQRGFINQLVKIFREEQSPTPTLINMYTDLGNIPFLPPNMDNKTRKIKLGIVADTDIPLLVKWLATPRPDGQQRVIRIKDEDENDQLATKMLDAIKQDFHNSTQPLPQPFYIKCDYPPHNLNILRSEEENAQTDETLTIMPNQVEDDDWWRIEIYRHPKGEHEKWAEDARKRMNNERVTVLDINIKPATAWPWTWTRN